MKLKKIMLVGILLLAILTIGSVSADDNVTEEVGVPHDEVIVNEVEQDDCLNDESGDINSEITISMPEKEFLKGDPITFAATINDGVMDVKVDGVQQMCNANPDSPDELSWGWYVNSTGIEVDSPHMLSVSIKNCSYYPDASKNFTFYMRNIIVDVPTEFSIEYDYWMDIKMPKDATGYVSVYINDNVVFSNVAKPHIDIDLAYYADLSTKDNVNRIVVNYTGDKAYPSYYRVFNATATYEIDAINQTYSGDESSMNYVFFIQKDLLKENLVVEIDGEKFETADGGYGAYSVDVSALDIGKHTVYIAYADEKHYPINVTRTIEISPKFDLDELAFYYGENNSMSLRLSKDATGNLSVYYENGTLFDSQKSVDGVAVVSFSKLNPGEYSFIARYDGDDYIVSDIGFTKSVDLKWQLIGNALYENAYAKVKAPESIGGTLSVNFDGSNYAGNRYEDGYFIIDLGNMSKAGSFEVQCIFIKDNKAFNHLDVIYINPKVTVPFKVTNGAESIIVEAPGFIGDVTVDAYNSKDSYSLSAKVVDGKATIPLDKLNAGKYDVRIVVKAENFFNSTKAVITVANSKLTANDLTKYYASATGFKVKVTNYKGKTVKSKYVYFYINGKFVKKVKTNKNGYATLKIAKAPGSYKISAKYGKVQITRKLTVKHALTLKTVTVKKSAKSLVLKATLKKGKTPIRYKYVKFYFNGKFVKKVKTSKYGVAKVTIKKATLKKLKVGKTVKYQATYLKDTVKKSAKVKR